MESAKAPNEYTTETKLRSFTKSMAWRISGVFILGVIAYLFTGAWTESLKISSAFNILRFVLYYFHERMWLRIEWGKVRHKPGPN